MEIAPGFEDSDWKELAFTSERDWVRAIAALRKRLEERFVKPARSLLRRERSGFAILALDSLLVETLQQFLEGVPETPKIVRNGRRVLASEEYFKAFLTSRYFGPGVDERTATLFYRTVRCGILHQAEVKESSLVRRDGPLVRLSADQRGVVVNPVLFHNRVEAALRSYLTDLRKRTETDLRRRFRDKIGRAHV